MSKKRTFHAVVGVPTDKNFCLRWCLLLLFCFAGTTGFGQAGNFPVRNGIEFHPRWPDNLVFLNNIGEEELPAEVQTLYKWAETVLADEVSKGFADLSNYRYFNAHCSKYGIRHLGGPMLGTVSDTSVNVWLRTAKPSEVSVNVVIDGKEKTFGPKKTTLWGELSTVIKVEGLQPNSTYPYRVLVDGESIEIPENARIRTSPSNHEVKTRIAFGSCFHRWGLGELAQTNAILNRKPYAFIGLGDIAAQDRMNNMGWHSLDYLARDLYPAWQKLVSEVPFYSLWDDHDYFGNDLGGIPEGYSEQDRQNVWKVFRHSWNNPSYGFGQEGKGVFFKTTIGAVDLITVDHRYFRSRRSFLGQEQMEWLEKELLACKSPFIILACGSMWSDYVSNGKDSWGAFDKKAREQILSLIEKNKIPGVLLISGDRHGSRGMVIERPSGFKFYEFEVASLGGLSGAPAMMPEWDNQFYGLSGGYAFGEFTFDTALADPTVTFRLISKEEKILHEKTLKRSDLSPK